MRRVALVLGAACFVLITTVGATPVFRPAAVAADLGRSNGSAAPFSASKSVSRTHLVNNADDVVDERTVHVTVSATANLRDRQTIDVSWSGAHPTGGLVSDHNSAAASLEEYPVVLMQCRGIDQASAPASDQVSPATCWTQTANERFQYSPTGFIYPAYRMDRYAVSADRAASVGQPDPLPKGCADLPAPHWIPFDAVDATVYPGGPFGCAGLAPEAANASTSLQPGNTTYGVANKNGDGSSKFIVNTTDSNASLGCSNTVACTLEIIPIEGVSCDPNGTAPSPGGMPVADRPGDADTVQAVVDDCTKTGHFVPGSFNGGSETPDLAVSGQLWWSASNWRNRISVPLSFAPSASVCNVVNSQATVYVYGAESLLQATQQWSPSFCLNPRLFNLRHVQTSEPQAKNLLAQGNIESAAEAAPPSTPFSTPTVQAPAAVTGWAIAFSIDDDKGNPVTTLKLDARLLAKLMSESYRSCADCLDFTSRDSRHDGFAALAENPIDMAEDPEFQALNPGITGTLYRESAATLSFMSSDSDLMYALTSYINADPEARAWLDGSPDPWGMYVNPAYQGIQLPLYSWPLLDTHLAQLGSGANLCLSEDPVPWLPLVSSPILNPSVIALDLQFDIANSQIFCKDNGTQTQKLTSIGRQTPGSRFVVGIVSLADAARYQLNVAQLQTQNADAATPFAASGRSFVAPTDAAMAAAAKRFVPDDSVGSWTVPYDTLRTDKSATGAYPGTVLLSLDVPTTGLPKGDAPRYAQLLRFVAGTGQTAGTGNGQLAAGYVPLTAADGLGAFAAYTDKAATAVEDQHCIVPAVSGAASRSTPCNVSGAGRTGTSAPPVVSSGSGGAPSAPPPAASSAPPGSPSSGSASGPGPTSSLVAAPVQRTPGLGAGPLGLALPILAVGALLALGLSAFNGGVGRRR